MGHLLNRNSTSTYVYACNIDIITIALHLKFYIIDVDIRNKNLVRYDALTQ